MSTPLVQQTVREPQTQVSTLPMYTSKLCPRVDLHYDASSIPTPNTAPLHRTPCYVLTKRLSHPDPKTRFHPRKYLSHPTDESNRREIRKMRRKKGSTPTKFFASTQDILKSWPTYIRSPAIYTVYR
jgi:hypothetical protein